MSGTAHHRNRRRRKKYARARRAAEHRMAAKTFTALGGGPRLPNWSAPLELATSSQLDTIGAQYGLHRNVDHVLEKYVGDVRRHYSTFTEPDGPFRDRLRVAVAEDQRR